MNGSNKSTWWNCGSLSGAIAVAMLAAICFVVVQRSTALAAAEPAAPPTSTLAIPFSGTVHTDVEDISVSGTLHIVGEVTLTQTTVFARVDTNISQTFGIGITSGQTFVGVTAPLTMCSIPAGSRSSSRIVMDLTSQYRLIPIGPLSSFYARGSREGPLLLILQITFQSDGTLIGANAAVSNVRVLSTPAIFR